ncbi:MAG: ester cyclase [Chloroflexi bacterium]|nr:ester cyclase [Chloroflexota bacterium]
MSVEEVKRIDEQGLAAWNSHNIDAFIALCADTIVWYDVNLPQPIKGKEGVRQYMQGWMTAFPDLKVRRKTTVAGEDTVAVELEFEGTHRGPLQGPPGMPAIQATGKRIKNQGAYFGRIRNGKIVEFSAHPDAAGLMMQLGVVPAMAR